MATLGTLLFWGVVAFGVMATASYVGTTAALRTYFGDDEFGPSDVVRIEEDGDR